MNTWSPWACPEMGCISWPQAKGCRGTCLWAWAAASWTSPRQTHRAWGWCSCGCMRSPPSPATPSVCDGYGCMTCRCPSALRHGRSRWRCRAASSRRKLTPPPRSNEWPASWTSGWPGASPRSGCSRRSWWPTESPNPGCSFLTGQTPSTSCCYCPFFHMKGHSTCWFCYRPVLVESPPPETRPGAQPPMSPQPPTLQRTLCASF